MPVHRHWANEPQLLISSSNADDMEMRGRELVQHLFGHICRSNIRAVEFFVSGDTDGSGELDFHEFSSALHAMNVQMHPADAELAFYTLDEEDEGALQIADIMDQYRAQVKSWQRNRMQIGAIAKWPQRTVINAEDCDDIGRQDWEAAAARASKAKVGCYSNASDEEDKLKEFEEGKIERSVYFKEVREAEEAEEAARVEAAQAAEAQAAFDKEEEEAKAAEAAAAKEEQEAQAAVAVAKKEEEEAREAFEVAKKAESEAVEAEQIAIARREEAVAAVADAKRELNEAILAHEEVEAARSRLRSHERNLKDCDQAGFWTDDATKVVDQSVSGRQAQFLRELEEAEAKLAKEQKEADEFALIAKQRLAAESEAAETARTARAAAEAAKLKASDEQAEAEAARAVAERELAEFYEAQRIARKEREDARRAKAIAQREAEEAEAAALRAKKERAEADAAKKAWQLKKQKEAEELFLKKRGIAKTADDAQTKKDPTVFKANDRREKMKIVKPAVEPRSYRARRLAAVARAVKLKHDLASLEHSFVRLPAITPRVPRVISTDRQHPSVSNLNKKPLRRAKTAKGSFSATLPELPGVSRQDRNLLQLRQIAGQSTAEVLAVKPHPPRDSRSKRKQEKLARAHTTNSGRMAL